MRKHFFCARNVEDYREIFSKVYGYNHDAAPHLEQNYFLQYLKDLFHLPEEIFDSRIFGETTIDGLRLDFNFGLRLDVPAGNFHVIISDFDTGQIFFNDNFSDGRLISMEQDFIRWHIEIFSDDMKIFEHVLNLDGQTVHVAFTKISGMGDILGFLPAVKELLQSHCLLAGVSSRIRRAFVPRTQADGQGGLPNLCDLLHGGFPDKALVRAVKRLDAEQMRALLPGFALCIDATHPYALRVSENLRAACASAGVPYRRLLRAACGAEGAVIVSDAAEAAEFLSRTEGRILLAIGSKDLAAFRGLDPERLCPRVLPAQASLSACEAAGIPHRNIIAMQGPFTRELNAALIRQYGIAWLVTKDGGTVGGFPEKAAAARETGAGLIVLRRPEEDGESFEEIAAACEELMKCRST